MTDHTFSYALPLKVDHLQISDTDALVQQELDARGKSHATHVRMPPDWTDSLEEAQYTLTKIQTRLKELSALQNKHLLKPTFDDSMNEEHQIDVFTQDITKVKPQIFLNITTPHIFCFSLIKFYSFSSFL